jgi:prolyl 4-hydroxylase
MTVDFGPSLQETFYAYVPPEVSSLYNRSASSDAAGGRAVATVPSRHRGLYAKFSNLSPNDLYVWTVVPESGQRTLAARIEPFGSYGTATHPGSKFAATLSADDSDSSVVVDWQVTEASGSNFHYDPFGGTQAARKALGDGSTGLALYQMQLKNLVFASQYRAFTGNEWLALYGQRMPPRFHMWRADAMGQTHAVETREIHFVENPDDSELRRGMSAYGPRPDQVGRMRRYRATHPTLNLTLTVLSGSPRVFEIQNFLSRVEVEHLLSLARGSGSSSFDPSQSTSPSDGSTTSQTWIERHRDFMVDAIYKRAADVLQMNEALLRIRRKSEIPEFVDSDIGVAERLQVVNYRVGQAEQPQYDFSVPNLVRLQPSRFATMVLYLNDDMEGGETTFPKWLNAESDEPLKVRGVCGVTRGRWALLWLASTAMVDFIADLFSPSLLSGHVWSLYLSSCLCVTSRFLHTMKIKPVLGKAILFYNMLPDGNYDERSLHASAPVVKGEKVRSMERASPCQNGHGKLKRSRSQLRNFLVRPVASQLMDLGPRLGP